MPDAPSLPPDTPAQKPAGLLSALMLGLGSIIGGGVFATMGTAVGGAGGAAPLVFLIGAIPAFLTAASYCRMVLTYPGQGGTIAYFNMAFGGGYVSASLNLLLIICYAAVASLYAGIFGVYLADIFDWHQWPIERICSCIGIVAVAFMNLSGYRWVRHVQGHLNGAKFLIMGVFVVAALTAPGWDWGNFGLRHWKGTGSIVAAGMTIFMSYQGFELIAASRRPYRRPERTVPLAFGICLGIVTLYYTLIAFCTVGNVDYGMVAQESSYLLSAVARRFMGEGGGFLLCLGALVASLSALNADVGSVSDEPEQMAAQRELPSYFAPGAKGAHALGVLFVCGLLILFVNLLSVAELTAIASLGFLVVYAVVNMACLRLTPRSRRALWLCGSAASSCLAAAIVVGFQLGGSPNARLLLGLTAAMLVLPFAWQAVYYLVRRYFLS